MGESKSLSERIRELLIARYPISYIVSTEEERVYAALKEAVDSLSSREIPLSQWSVTTGLVRGSERIAETDPVRVLDRIASASESGVFLLKDMHHFLPSNPTLIRRFKDLYVYLRDKSKFVFLVSPRALLPEDLKKDVAVIEAGLPSAKELETFFTATLEKVRNEKKHAVDLDDNSRRKFVRALQGLTLNEARHALNRVLFGRERVDESALRDIFEEKAMLTRKGGVLEFVPTRVTLADVGGLENLKEWLRRRKHLFSQDSKDVASLLPKGVLMMGISGCGKSLSAKVISDLWELPLFRLDMNNLYSGVYGPPEEAFNLALSNAETVAPAVLWIDEIEMGIAGYQSSEMSGTSARIFASFLTWMQEKESSVFIAATANRIDLLPAEVLRKGRFDQVFFCDLPTEKEREAIFRVHLLKREHDMTGIDLTILAKGSKGWNGAEIEQCVASALIDTLAEKRTLTANDLYRQMSQIVPLSHTMSEQIKAIKSWAHDRAVNASQKETKGA